MVVNDLKVLIRFIALYVCGTWGTTKSDENKLGVFKMFGPKKNNESEFEVKLNEELERLFELNIIGIMKSSRRWTGHVWWISEFVLQNITKNGPEGDPNNGGLIESRKTSG